MDLTDMKGEEAYWKLLALLTALLPSLITKRVYANFTASVSRLIQRNVPGKTKKGTRKYVGNIAHLKFFLEYNAWERSLPSDA